MKAQSRLQRLESGQAPPDPAELASAYVSKANALYEVGRPEEALSQYDDIVERFGASESADVLEKVAWALRNKALRLRGLGEREAATATVRSMHERLRGQQDVRLRALVLDGRVLDALLLFDEDRFDQGLARLRAVVEEIGESPPAPLLVPLAHALTAQARRLTELGRYTDALVVCAAMLKRFESSDDPDIREQVAQVILARGDSLSAVGQEVAAVDAYTKVLDRFSPAESPILRGVLADALLERARSKGSLGEDDDAVADIEQYVAEYWETASPGRRVRALGHKAAAYINLGRLEDALALLDEILSCREAEADKTTRDVFAGTIYCRGVILERMRRLTEARAAYADVVRRFGDLEQRDVDEIVSLADARLRALDAEQRSR